MSIGWKCRWWKGYSVGCPPPGGAALDLALWSGGGLGFAHEETRGLIQSWPGSGGPAALAFPGLPKQAAGPGGGQWVCCLPPGGSANPGGAFQFGKLAAPGENLLHGLVIMGRCGGADP